MKQYYKIRFYNDTDMTAGVVCDTERHPIGTSVADYSRLFPYSEASKMKRFYRGPLCATFEQAFLSGMEAN